MGMYINAVSDSAKFEFVEKHGNKIFEAPRIFDNVVTPDAWVRAECSIGIEKLPVVVFNNKSFYAFAIAYNLKEFDRLVNPDDDRIDSIWLVDRKVLEDMIPKEG